MTLGLHVAGLESAPSGRLCSVGQASLIDFLVSKGAVVNATDYHGSSPLHLACQKGYQSVTVSGRARPGRALRWASRGRLLLPQAGSAGPMEGWGLCPPGSAGQTLRYRCETSQSSGERRARP